MTESIYKQSETQPIINEMIAIAKEGYQGGIVMSANGKKTKNLSIDVDQAKLIQCVLVEIESESGRTKSCPSVSIEVTFGAFEALELSYDVLTRVNVTDELILDTRSIPDSELENIASILKVDAEEIEECYVVVYHRCKDSWSDVIPNYTYDWAVSDQNGNYTLETDYKQEALEHIKEKNGEMKSQGEKGSCALMMKDPCGEGYTLSS